MEDSSKAEKSDRAQKTETKPIGSANAVVAQQNTTSDGCWLVDLVPNGMP